MYRAFTILRLHLLTLMCLLPSPIFMLLHHNLPTLIGHSYPNPTIINHQPVILIGLLFLINNDPLVTIPTGQLMWDIPDILTLTVLLPGLIFPLLNLLLLLLQ